MRMTASVGHIYHIFFTKWILTHIVSWRHWWRGNRGARHIRSVRALPKYLSNKVNILALWLHKNKNIMIGSTKMNDSNGGSKYPFPIWLVSIQSIFLGFIPLPPPTPLHFLSYFPSNLIIQAVVKTTGLLPLPSKKAIFVSITIHIEFPSTPAWFPLFPITQLHIRAPSNANPFPKS